MDQLRDLYEECETGKVWFPEVLNILEGTHGHRSVHYALKQVFPNISVKPNQPGVIYGLELQSKTSLAEELEDDEKDPPPPQAPCTCEKNVIGMLKKELERAASYKAFSILRDEDLEQFTYERVCSEVKDRMPTLYTILNELIKTDNLKKEYAMITVILKICFIYNTNLNSYAKIQSLRYYTSGCSKEMMTESNKLFDCVSYNTILNVLDAYATQVDNIISSWSGSTDVVHVVDNVDKRLHHRHEMDNKSAVDLHMYNNMLYKIRIDCSHLSDVPPIPPVVTEVPFQVFIPSAEEQAVMVQRLETLVLETWHKIDVLKSQTAELQTLNSHKYYQELSTKSDKAHLGVVLKNEAKTSDVIDILSYCEQYPKDFPHSKMVYRGDYLTYERVKSAMSASYPQLNKFTPSFGDFHLQMTWVQAIFDRFYEKSSARDSFSLHGLKNLLNSKQVTPDTRQNYWACDFFLDKILDGYLIGVAHKVFKLESGGDNIEQPSSDKVVGESRTLVKNVMDTVSMELPTNKCNICDKVYKSYNNLKKHIKTQHPGDRLTAPSVNDEVDCSNLYCTQLMKMLLLKRHLDKCIKLGDGENLLLTVKFMLLYFKTGNFRKYSLLSFEFIAQVNFFLSPKMRELVLYERFVNNMGRPGENVPMDQDVEFNNRLVRKNLSSSSHFADPSENLLNRVSKSVDKINRVHKSFKSSFNLEVFHGKRKVLEEAYMKEIMKIMKVFTHHNVYGLQSGRKMYTPQLNIAAVADPLANIDLFQLKQWMVNAYTSMTNQPFYQY